VPGLLLFSREPEPIRRGRFYFFLAVFALGGAGFLAAGAFAFAVFFAAAGLIAFSLLIAAAFLALAAAAFPFAIGSSQQINSDVAHPHASSTVMTKPQALQENKSPFLTLAMCTSHLIFDLSLNSGLLVLKYMNYGNISISLFLFQPGRFFFLLLLQPARTPGWEKRGSKPHACREAGAMNRSRDRMGLKV